MRLITFDNPYISFAGAFSFALLLYSPHLSSMFPALSATVYVILGLSITISLLAALLTQERIDKIRGAGQCILEQRKRSSAFRILICLTPFALLEIALYPKLPIVTAIHGAAMGPKDFIVEYGIPTVHAIIIALCQITIVQGINELFVGSTARRKALIAVLSSIALLVIFLSRGALVISLMAALYCNFSRLKSFSLKNISITLCILTISLILFGRIGDLRSGGSDYILSTGGANTDVFGAVVPSEVFWSYVYLTSPLANLERTVQTRPIDKGINFDALFTLDIVPDVISKRMSGSLAQWTNERPLINSAFTVGTIFSRPYYFSGMIGSFLIFFWWAFVTRLSLLFARKSQAYTTTILGFTNVLGFFCVFTNTVVFSSIMGPIIICALLGLLSRLRKDVVHGRIGISHG